MLREWGLGGETKEETHTPISGSTDVPSGETGVVIGQVKASSGQADGDMLSGSASQCWLCLRISQGALKCWCPGTCLGIEIF